jgi:hypothetical protein
MAVNTTLHRLELYGHAAGKVIHMRGRLNRLRMNRSSRQVIQQEGRRKLSVLSYLVARLASFE